METCEWGVQYPVHEIAYLFSLSMIDFGYSAPNYASYSGRICILCFFPVTMTSLSTSSKGRDRPKSVFASADATLTLSKGASVVSDLLSVDGQAAKFGAGGCFFLSPRSLCTLSAICWSNEHIYAGFGGKVGPLAPELCVLG